MSGAHNKDRLPAAIALGAASWWGWDALGRAPILLEGGQINPLPALAAGGMFLAGTVLATDLCRIAARFADWRKARKPTGLKGTAGWVRSLREVRKELRRSSAPYCGALHGDAILAPFESSMLVVGPSGSGKNVSIFQPGAMALDRDSKVFVDFRSNQTPVLEKPLRERGEENVVFNLGGKYEDILGPSARYNPLRVVVDCFHRPGGLLDVEETVTDMCLWLYPEPKGGGGNGENHYFREGSRTLIATAIFLCVLTQGAGATLGDVLQLLNDRTRFLAECRLAAGRLEQAGGGAAELPIWNSPWVAMHPDEDVRRLVDWFRAQASGDADLLGSPDPRTLESFLTGAQQALKPFNITTRAARILQDGDFRFGALKEGMRPTNVFFMIDPNKIETQSRVLGLLIYCMNLELRTHPNVQRDVYIFADEISNIPWPGFGSLLTWGRAYHTKLVIFVQNFPAFRERHGEDITRTLQSECEIQLYLPGQREPETLAYLEKKLGTASVMVKGNRGSAEKGPFGLDGYDLREDGRCLLTGDEIRRFDKGILFIRNNKPMAVDTPPIAAIAPWRKRMGIDPFYGKRFLKRVRLRIKSRVRFWF